MRVAVFGSLFLFLWPLLAHSTTWDEPWQEAVVKNADTFVKATVVKTGPKQITLKILKQVAGEKTPDELIVDQFSLLALTSVFVGDDHELRFNFAANEDWYFLLKKGKDNKNWAIATPTAGFAGAADGKVYATYRHTYHQALVDEDLYEASMTAIFQYLHGQKVDPDYPAGLFKKYLTQPPQPLKVQKNEKRELFFQQHVALETFYYLGLPEDLNLLEPFLKTSDFHVKVSAVRALSRIDTPQARQRLWNVLTADGDGFARVMAVWGLKRLDAREYLPKLQEFVKTAPTERTGFGGNIMDPRVGTHFPQSIKAACEQLIAEWSKRPADPATLK